MTTRREFVRDAGVAAAAVAFGTKALSAGSEPKKTLLILGGTRFLGPEIVDAAKASGWTITLFNRGKTNPGLFPDLEKLQGDRERRPQVARGALLRRRRRHVRLLPPPGARLGHAPRQAGREAVRLRVVHLRLRRPRQAGRRRDGAGRRPQGPARSRR